MADRLSRGSESPRRKKKARSEPAPVVLDPVLEENIRRAHAEFHQAFAHLVDGTGDDPEQKLSAALAKIRPLIKLLEEAELKKN